MELKKLYPLWVKSISKEGYVMIDYNVLQILKLSLIHQANLVDIFGVDKRGKIEVNWVLWSYEFEYLYKLRSLSDKIYSCCWLWLSANWLEREVWEMFGIIFIGHPDLRRLLTDYGFKGYPLLKTYPLVGYNQLYYSEKNKRITAQPVFLAQEFREFDFNSPWLN